LNFDLLFTAYLATEGDRLDEVARERVYMTRTALQFRLSRWAYRWRDEQYSLNMREQGLALERLIKAEAEMPSRLRELPELARELYRDLILQPNGEAVMSQAAPLSTVNQNLDEAMISDVETLGIDFLVKRGSPPSDREIALGERAETTVYPPYELRQCGPLEQVYWSSYFASISHGHFAFVRLWLAADANAEYWRRFECWIPPVLSNTCPSELEVIRDFEPGSFFRFSKSREDLVGPWFFYGADFRSATMINIAQSLSLFRMNILTDVFPKRPAKVLASLAAAHPDRQESGGGQQYSFWEKPIDPSQFRLRFVLREVDE
jgi:hypothetical protein